MFSNILVSRLRMNSLTWFRLPLSLLLMLFMLALGDHLFISENSPIILLASMVCCMADVKSASVDPATVVKYFWYCRLNLPTIPTRHVSINLENNVLLAGGIIRSLISWVDGNLLPKKSNLANNVHGVLDLHLQSWDNLFNNLNSCQWPMRWCCRKCDLGSWLQFPRIDVVETLDGMMMMLWIVCNSHGSHLVLLHRTPV